MINMVRTKIKLVLLKPQDEADGRGQTGRMWTNEAEEKDEMDVDRRDELSRTDGYHKHTWNTQTERTNGMRTYTYSMHAKTTSTDPQVKNKKQELPAIGFRNIFPGSENIQNA